MKYFMRGNILKNTSFAVFVLFAVCWFFPGKVFADESPPDEFPAKEIRPDELPRYSGDFRQAFSQGMASNILIWGWDYFIVRASYAQIGPRTWKENLQEGMEWDNSDFFTNQILHPYHGATYYSPARAYGFSFWESIPFTLFGSFVWEFFGERDTASLNDFIVTSTGGIAMGESGYRLAVALTNGRASGVKKFFREFAALVVNPIYMLNKWMVGEPFVERNRLPRTRLDFILRAGFNLTWDDEARFSSIPHSYIGGIILYGDPYDERAVYSPYDYFYVQADANLDWKNPSWDIFGYAVLYGHKLFIGNETYGLLGLFQQFDYLENLVYKLASNGAGPGFQLSILFPSGSSLEFLSHFYGVVLGVVDSRYSRRGSGLYHSMGPGASLKVGLKYYAPKHFSLGVNFNSYWFYTESGDDKDNTVDILTVSGEVPLGDDLNLGVEFHLYRRWSDAGVDNATARGFRAYLAYKL
jgi:hypothetical protein